MGCNCGGTRRPMVGELIAPQTATVTAAAGQATWVVTYPTGVEERTGSLLDARRKARAGNGRVSAA